MSLINSNNYQIFYCPPVVIPPQIQRPMPQRQQAFHPRSHSHEIQSAVCSSSSSSQPPPPQPQLQPQPPPLPNPRPTLQQHQQLSLQQHYQQQLHFHGQKIARLQLSLGQQQRHLENLPQNIVTIEDQVTPAIKTPSPGCNKVTSAASPRSSTPIPSPSPSSSDKTIKISITRKKLKVTRGFGNNVNNNCDGTTGISRDVVLVNDHFNAGHHHNNNNVNIVNRVGIINRAKSSRAETVASLLERRQDQSIRPIVKRVRFVSDIVEIPTESCYSAPPPIVLRSTDKRAFEKKLATNHRTSCIVTKRRSPSTTLLQDQSSLKSLKRCSYCDTDCLSEATVVNHMLTTHFSTMTSDVYTCIICDTVYTLYDDFADHCLSNHSYTGVLPEPNFVNSEVRTIRSCTICKITYSSIDAIKCHYTAHRGPNSAYRCRLCRKAYLSILQLATHLGNDHHFKSLLPVKSSSSTPTPSPPTLTPPLAARSLSSASSEFSSVSELSSFTTPSLITPPSSTNGF